MKSILKSGKSAAKKEEIEEEESGGKVGYLKEISLNVLIKRHISPLGKKKTYQFSTPQLSLILALTRQSIFDKLNYIAILNIINFV